ncbi:nucleotidyltransferase [Gudongella sp. DL1XJH-153]|uniref:nucleotidyltransferase n=1 Tax=Gudongella sp. DL1XJH-153 TaxID=3409804 RepID=UPI003BB4D274
MKLAGLITEYNPFHFGHRVHIENTKNLTGASHIIAVMSGSFVQRGEPALVDKWTRAEMAIKNGVDLVVELPFIYSVQTAELFASGSTKILESINSTDYLVFGSESGNIDELDSIASILAFEPPLFKKLLKEHLNYGNSFSVSRSLALKDYAEANGIELGDTLSIIKESNNILGIEYLKSLKRLESSIIPITFQRLGDKYSELEVKSEIASATAIRHRIKENGIESAIELLPQSSYDSIFSFIKKYGKVNGLGNYSQIINYLLCVKSATDISDYFDVEIGLENRIKDLSRISSDPLELIKAISTKRYTETRIQRMLIHMLVDLKKEAILDAFSNEPGYIRVLASNKKGFEIINKIKENSEIEIINKLSDSMNKLNKTNKSILLLDILATDLYYLGLDLIKPEIGMDFKKSPYINIHNG